MCLNTDVYVDAKIKLDIELQVLQNFYSQKLKLWKALRDDPGSIAKLVFVTECIIQNRPAKKM